MPDETKDRDRPRYDEKTVRRHIWSTTLQDPLTLWPTGFGLLAAFGMVLITSAAPLTCLLVMVGGTIVGAVNLVLKYNIRGPLYAALFIQKLHEKFEEEKERRKAQLVIDLKDKEVDCEEGIQQVEQFDTKFRKIQTVLQRKLDKGELTYSRYLASAEDLYTRCLKTLERVVVIRMAMDDKGIVSDRETVKRLSKKASLTDAEQRTLKSAQGSVSVYEKGLADVQDLLAQNEEALTALDTASAAIAKIDAGGDLASIKFALEDLMDLASRADRSQNVVEVNLGKQST